MQHERARTRVSRLRHVFSLLCAFLLTTAVAAPMLMAQRPELAEHKIPPAVAKEYQQRFKALDPEDARGHYALAQWCNDQEQYELVLAETEYVLKLDPKFVEARLLRTAALRKLGRDANARAQAPAEVGLLAMRDVQKLRFVELLDYRPSPDSTTPQDTVQVRFDKGVLNDFLKEAANLPEFAGRENRRRFLSLKPTQQVEVIRRYSGTDYQSRIEILTDPLVFRRFKPVATIIERGCGGMGCHGGENPAPPFGLRGSYLFPEQSLYTQFLILDRVVLGRYRIIDRNRPADSLVLQYGLPAGSAHQPHPTPIKLLYPGGTSDANYSMVLDWISLLRFPRPATGIKFEGYPEPLSPGAQLAAQSAGGASSKPADVRP